MVSVVTSVLCVGRWVGSCVCEESVGRWVGMCVSRWVGSCVRRVWVGGWGRV